jgi:competence protein ComEC
MQLINLTAFKITFALACGILISHYTAIPLDTLHLLLAVSFMLLILAWFRSQKLLIQDFAFGSIALISLILMGMWVYQMHKPLNHSGHYTHNISLDEEQLVQLKIKSTLRPDLFNKKYVAEIQYADGVKVSGKVLLLVTKEINQEHYQVGDLVLTYTNFQDLPSPKNPYQFDYAAYLNKQGIYHQFQLRDSLLIQHFKGTPGLRGKAANFRDNINRELIKNGFEGDPLALINALLLGQRQELSPQVYSDFAAAGAVHILAVSGLHVGIILLILKFVFKPMERWRRGKTVKVITIIICLWCFALIAGLSPSVLRAVTMFSLLAIALESGRTNIRFSALLASAFLLLLINPNLLFHVGFQMSYLAVFTILWIVPMFEKWRPRYKIFSIPFDIITVTLAAQLGVGALSVYYFNYFPGLFFLTNLVIIPFLGIILGSGILVILLTQLKVYHPLLSDAYTWMLETLLSFIQWVARQDRFYFDEISLSVPQVLSLYLGIIILIVVVNQFRVKKLGYLLASVLVIQTTFIQGKIETNTNELVIFNKSRNTVIGIKQADRLTIFSNLDDTLIQSERMIKVYKTKTSISQVEISPLPDALNYLDKTIVVIDSFALYPVSQKGVDVLLLRNSPRLHPERLIDSLNPKKIVADGSNYTTYVNHWRETAQKRKLPFHHTGKEGAFVLK